MKKSFAEQLTEAQELVAAANKERDEARADAANHSQALAAAQTDLQASKDALKAEQEAHAKTTDEAKAYAVEIADLKAKLAVAEQSSGKKAQDALAAIGAPPVAEEPANAPKPITSKADAVAELDRLSKEDPAKAREFYLKHKQLLTSKG
jgi:chromosome segregation ATPase